MNTTHRWDDSELEEFKKCNPYSVRNLDESDYNMRWSLENGDILHQADVIMTHVDNPFTDCSFILS